MLTFIAASLILILIPGPDQALVTRNTLAGGRAGGLLTMTGGALGISVHASCAALGVSALLATSPTAFMALKLTGTAYLAWMGISSLLTARRGVREKATEEPSSGEISLTRRLRFVRQGFLSNALNPKVALFFLTFLPQFLPTHARLIESLIFCLVFALLYVAWFSSYTLIVGAAGKVLRRPKVKATIERVTGILLIGFALRLVILT